MKLKAPQQEKLARAVAAAEAHTSAEVVLVILPRSRAYVGVPSLLAVLAAYATLAWMLFSEDIEVDALHVLPALVLMGGAVFALANLVPLSWVTTARARRAAVDTQAHASFSRHGVYRTSGRTGILVFLSAAEGQARILMDRGVVEAVPQAVRNAWLATFGKLAARVDVDAVAAALEALGREAGTHLPRSADDVDELSNTVHGAEDLT
jgi:putative membrane protein